MNLGFSVSAMDYNVKCGFVSFLFPSFAPVDLKAAVPKLVGTIPKIGEMRRVMGAFSFFLNVLQGVIPITAS